MAHMRFGTKAGLPTLVALSVFFTLQPSTSFAQGGGGAGGGAKQGTVTSITEGLGIDLTPDTITTTGSVAIDTTVVPRLGVSNTFTANQAITGNLNVSGVIALPPSSATAGVLTLGGSRFLHGFGSGNTSVGEDALNFITTGNANTAVGWRALRLNAAGHSNTGVGLDALGNNTSGSSNTAVGRVALGVNQGGNNNTAVGNGALAGNQANNNTAVGFQSLFGGPFNTGEGNSAVGLSSLRSNTTGNVNTAIGLNALFSNTAGNYNTASGFNALFFNTEGGGNTASGAGALSNNTTGLYNIAIGYNAGLNATTGDYNIYIGNAVGGVAAEGNTIRIGDSNQTRTFIAGIFGATTGATGIGVVVDENGQLGTVVSSRRFKYDIQDMDQASAKLLQLRPVTFRYKQSQTDGSHPLQYGLIAEEVAEIYPELVQRGADGQVNTVLYHVLPSLLLSEFQKQHRQIQEQQETINSLTEQMARLVTETRQLQAEIMAMKDRQDRGHEVAAALTH